MRRQRCAHPRGPGARGAQPRARCLLLAALAAATLLAAGVATAEPAGAAPAADAGADPARPSADEPLGRLTRQVDGLHRSIESLNERIEGNRRLIAEQAGRLEAEIEPMDPTALRLDSLVRQLAQAQALVDEHETRIESNSVRLFETLMGIDEAARTLARLDARFQRAEGLAGGLPAVLPVAASAAGGALPGVPGPFGDVLRPAPMPVGLGLLLPAGILLYAYARRRPSAGEAAVAPAVPLAALAGAALGFMLLGIGIREGASLGGVLGAPFEPLSALWWARADPGLPAIAHALLRQLPVLCAMALLAAVTVGPRLSAAGALAVGLLLGGVLLPLFGHWSAMPAAGSQAAGWLAGLGFDDGAGVAGTALVGGGAALGLALGLRAQSAARPDAVAPAAAAGREAATLPAIAVLLIWIGWVEPLAVAAGPDSAAALAVTGWAVAVGAFLGFALLDGLLPGKRARLDGPVPALVAGAIAAPALGAQAGLLPGLAFGAAVGLLHVLLAPGLNRRSGGAELAVAFTVAGIAAALVPVLVGPVGLPRGSAAAGLPVQLLGACLALGLGIGSGRLLARAVRSLPGHAPACGAGAGPRAEVEAPGAT